MVISFKNILRNYACCCCIIMDKRNTLFKLINIKLFSSPPHQFLYNNSFGIYAHVSNLYKKLYWSRLFWSSFNRYASKDFGRPHPTCGFPDGIIRRVGVGSARGGEADLWPGHQRSIMSTPGIREHGRIWTAPDERRRHGDRGRQEMAAW